MGGDIWVGKYNENNTFKGKYYQTDEENIVNIGELEAVDIFGWAKCEMENIKSGYYSAKSEIKYLYFIRNNDNDQEATMPANTIVYIKVETTSGLPNEPPDNILIIKYICGTVHKVKMDKINYAAFIKIENSEINFDQWFSLSTNKVSYENKIANISKITMILDKNDIYVSLPIECKSNKIKVTEGVFVKFKPSVISGDSVD
jgi:hypothetical protein